jgi:carbon-monoxide dehydrogenase medium subunit
MPTWNNYHLAKSIDDALQALETSPAPCRVVAGGTDLLLDLQQGRQPPVDTLVDVTCIPELTCLEIRDTSLFIGAAVPLKKIADALLVHRHALALVEACNLIGGPQVRNTATLGGNVAHALPAGDGTIALLALDAQAEIASKDGQRKVPLHALYLGPGVTSLRSNQDLLVGFHLPLLTPTQGSAFARIMRPQGVALPILNMACWLERDGDQIVDIRIAIGPAGPTPVRASSAEKALLGQRFTQNSIACANEAIREDTKFRTSPQRATAGYRTHLTSTLLETAVTRAWERAEGTVTRQDYEVVR